MSQFPVEVIAELPSVVMFTAPNAGPKTLDGTHTYIVGKNGAYVIDPGPLNPEYQDCLFGWIKEQRVSVQGILLTHRHPDHAPGTVALRKRARVPVWSSSTDNLEGVDPVALQELRDGDFLETDGDRLRVVSTPGHTPDHLGFWLEKALIFFAGDTILGEGSTLIAPPEGDMALYLHSLENIRALRPRLIAPGHGPVIRDPEGKIEEYVRHREKREEQLVHALERGPGTVEELVARVYADVDPTLHGLAQGSVEAQLVKLAADGKVMKAGDVYRQATTSE